jgi:hypothetical protein
VYAGNDEAMLCERGMSRYNVRDMNVSWLDDVYGPWAVPYQDLIVGIEWTLVDVFERFSVYSKISSRSKSRLLTPPHGE